MPHPFPAPMKPFDVTQYVFDVTIGFVLLMGMTTSDVMHLFGKDRSLHYLLVESGRSQVLSVVLTFATYLAAYVLISRLLWKLLLWLRGKLFS